MGCLCSKESATVDDILIEAEKESGNISKQFAAPSSKKKEVGVDGDDRGARYNGKGKPITTPPESIVPETLSAKGGEKKERKVVEMTEKRTTHQRALTMDTRGAKGGDQNFRINSMVPNVIESEYVSAGWPSWLTSVAAKAVNGWLPRRADSFEKLDKIGQGTYSSVFKARDLETGKVVALKQVRFVNTDPESVRFMAREINILRRLDHPNVLKLEGIIASTKSSNLYLVFEYMEHDLAGLLATSGVKFSEPQVKCYMQQLLRGLEHCHGRGVLHRDIKGSNLLVDNNGILKIADFGLSTFFNPKDKQPMTSRVVTLWYRPPELLLGATDYGVSVDLWSAGCILAELLAGKPIMPGRTEVEQMHKIFKLCGSPSEDYWKKSKLPHSTIFKPQQPYKRCVTETFKDFPSSALALLDVLLSIEPKDRKSSSSALNSEFFTTKPLPCDPSSLPKYPPSKEFDAKLRDEEVRRINQSTRLSKDSDHLSSDINNALQGTKEKKAAKIPFHFKWILLLLCWKKAESMKGCGVESIRREPRDSRIAAAPQSSVQKRQGLPNPKSTSEKYIPEEDGAQNGFSLSGPLMQPGTFGSSRNKNLREDDIQTAAGHTSRTQRSHLPQGSASIGVTSRSTTHRYNELDVSEPSEKQEWVPSSNYKKSERITNKESARAYANKKNRIHCSGPLFPSGGGNIDDMLKEHERQIQEAVRKARIDKSKSKKGFD